jgi:hypothetical protein
LICPQLKSLRVAQKVAHRGEETADLLGIHEAVVGSQEQRHDIDGYKLIRTGDHFVFYRS